MVRFRWIFSATLMGCVPAQMADELRRLLQLQSGPRAWMAVRWPYGKGTWSNTLRTATLSHLTRLLKIRHLPRLQFHLSLSPPFPQFGKCINAFISPRLPGILCTLLYLIVYWSIEILWGVLCECVFFSVNLKKKCFWNNHKLTKKLRVQRTYFPETFEMHTIVSGMMKHLVGNLFSQIMRLL